MAPAKIVFQYVARLLALAAPAACHIIISSPGRFKYSLTPVLTTGKRGLSFPCLLFEVEH
jgi:hypothetical protein